MKDLDQIANLLEEMDNLKLMLNKIDLFKSSVDEQLGEGLSEILACSGEKVAQQRLNEAVSYVLCTFEEKTLISVKGYLMTLPNPKLFISNIKSLTELTNAIIQFFYAFPLEIVKLIDAYTLDDLGKHRFYNEMPLFSVQDFIDVFNLLLNEDIITCPYYVTTYDLNDEAVVMFKTEAEAKEFAISVAPSSVCFADSINNCLREVACY